MNKIVSIKKTSAIFLVIVLVTGTIATFYPSFMVGAQAEPYYGMDDRYDSYESTEYPSESTDREYNSYEPREYPSYKPDYKPEYPSDNSYTPKKESNISVSINKLNCINNNVNINGDNTGAINVGNSGKSATGSGTDEGYVGVGSLGGNGEGYDNGYKKQKDQGFSCIINNNNNNTIVTGNATDDNGNVPDTCEECFREFLDQPQINAFLQLNLAPTLERLCSTFLINIISESAVITSLTSVGVGLSVDDAQDLVDCLKRVGVIFGT